MPYRDVNGTIMIDEVEAGTDIANLNKTKEALVSALNNIKYIITLNNDFQGMTAEAINEATIKYSASISEQIRNIDDTIDLINKVVNAYMTTDQSIANTINTTL